MLLKIQKLYFIVGLFIYSSTTIHSQQSMSNPGNPSGVLIGDLDISGSQITVEALIRRTGAGGPNIVSKHTDPSNVNYLLRPTTFELTTTNGFLLMTNPYTLQNNRWYHIAGTYDGAHVRYYVNGCLVVEQPWTGNLVTNNLQACIGNISSGFTEGFVGQIDEVRIWNIARTEAQIKQNMVDLPAPGTYPNLRAYYKFEGNYNNVLGTGFNGVANGTPTLITTTGELPTEFRIVIVNATDNVICNGANTGSITIVPSVEQGTTYSLNGGTYQGNNVFSNLTAGTYTVAARSQEGCILSETVTIVDGVTLHSSSDQTICEGETVQLNATGGSGVYTWDSHSSLSSTSIANPTASPTTTTTYTVRSKVRTGPSLVINGNFEMGSVGFTSEYTNFTTGTFHQGHYIVTSNSPTIYNAGFSNCSDHTGSGGGLLLADGACGTNGVPSNANLWCQTIQVSPNTDYEFSAWLTNVVSNSVSSTLSFSINGVDIGNPTSTSTTPCVWEEFFVTWNSGSATSATICIAEGTGVCGGNDFAVDDISFYELCELTDVVTITVRPNPDAVISGDTSVCRNSASPGITISGNSGTAPYIFTYNVNGGASQTIVSNASGEAVISVPTTISGIFEYEITHVEDANGCENTISEFATVTVVPDPTATISGTTEVCLNDGAPTITFEGSSGVATYDFTYSVDGGTSQTITSDGSGTATITVPTLTAGTYEYELTEVEDANGCTSSLSQTVVVTVHSLPVITASDASVCSSGTVDLTASGAIDYAWSPATNLSSSTGATVTFTPGSNTTYTVTGTDANGCVNSSSLDVMILPNANIVASSDISICLGTSTSISASGGVSYSWNNGVGSGSNHTVSPTVTTTYIVNGEDASGCEGSDEVIVTVLPDPTATISGTIAVCLNDASPTLTFSGNSGAAAYTFTYSVNGGTPQTIGSDGSGIATVTVPTLTAGTYEYELTEVEDANGCISSLAQTVVVTVHSLPVITAPDASVCTLETVGLTASGAVNYTWSPATNLSSAAGATVTFTAGPTTTYTVTGTDANGCVNTANVTVVVHSLPFVEAGADIFGCENDLHILSASGDSGVTFSWDNGVVDGTPFVAPVGITTYTVIGTDPNGCQNSDFLTVSIQEVPEISFTSQQDGHCYPVTAQFTNTTPLVQNCLWIFENGQTVSGCGTVSHVFNQSGVYGVTLQVESMNGCVNQLFQDSMVIIDPYPVASFNFSPAAVTTLNPEVQFFNTSSGATSYNWNFGYEGPVSHEVSPSYVYPYDKGRTYDVTLIAISENGCRDTATVAIGVKEELIFYIPNTFTPDNNEFNQTFSPVFTSGYDPFIYTLIIFNRWGEQLFESHDATVGWDGTYGGKVCSSGTYTWRIEVKTLASDERKTFTGHVNLLR